VTEIRDHFENVLTQIITDEKNSTLSEIKLLTKAEEQKLLFDFNDTASEYPKDKTIVDLFEEQAAKTPDNVAVVFEDKQLTYRELNERSNQLAHYLQSKGVTTETLVPVCIERSIEMIMGYSAS
jgi:non-ribosomal peptide synthetase component F